MKTRKMMLRISVVLLFTILIWRFILYLNGMFLGDEYQRTSHFFIALTTTILSLILIDTVRRIDKISWKALGMKGIRANIGLLICLLTGWAKIAVTTDLNQLLLFIYNCIFNRSISRRTYL